MQSKCPMTYGSPRWTNEIADCSLPVTFDTYSNCSFGCVYCFSQYQRGLGKSAEKYFKLMLCLWTQNWCCMLLHFVITKSCKRTALISKS